MVLQEIDPIDIRYTQDSIKAEFQNGKTIKETLKSLIKGEISPRDIKPPIRVFTDKATIFSVDNRFVEHIPVHALMPYIW